MNNASSAVEHAALEDDLAVCDSKASPRTTQ